MPPLSLRTCEIPRSPDREFSHARRCHPRRPPVVRRRPDRLRRGPLPSRPDARGAGSPGALVRGPRDARGAPEAPGDGRHGRPVQRGGPGPDGPGRARRPVAEARGRGRVNPVRPRQAGHARGVRRPPPEDGLQGRRPVRPRPLVRGARPEGSGEVAPDGGDPARPGEGVGMEAAWLSEARRSLGDGFSAQPPRNPKPRRRSRPTGTGSRSWRSGRGCSPSRRGKKRRRRRSWP